MVDSTTIATASLPGTISTGGRLASAVGDIICANGLVSGHEAEDEGAPNGSTGEVSCEKAVGVGAHTSWWIGKEGIHDSESWRFGEGERAKERDIGAVEAASAANGVAAWARGLAVAVVEDNVT